MPYDRAIVDFTRALRLDPKLALAYYNRSSTFSKKGEHERGLADYNRALRLDPKIATAHYNRVIAYSTKGGHEPARADYHQPKPIVAGAGKK
jgi:tetratricopeptide (TPR) repeat protein